MALACASKSTASCVAGTTTTGASSVDRSSATTQLGTARHGVASEGGTVLARSRHRKEERARPAERESISTRVISRLLVATSEREVVEYVAELHHVTSEEIAAAAPVRASGPLRSRECRSGAARRT